MSASGVDRPDYDFEFQETVGGGEVLQYIGSNDQRQYFESMDTDTMAMFKSVPYVKGGIVILMCIISLLFILKLYSIKSISKGKAIISELQYLDKVQKHDASVLQANRLMRNLTNLVEHSMFKLSNSSKEYWNYNLERANVRVPGKFRIMKAEEFNACIKCIEVIALLFELLISIFVNTPIGIMLMIATAVLSNTIPMAYIRTIVKAKDGEIVENFADFYLMIHYVLLAGAGTPLSGIMKSFDKTTSSEEMHRFIDVCVGHIDTYGEYSATRYIARQYREIPQVNKLMRLIRQANEGGDVRAELLNFREELLNAKKYEIEKRMNKLINKAKASFYVLMPILIQAVISAMAIYFPDISVAGSWF